MSQNPNQIRLTAMTIRGLAGALLPEADHIVSLAGPLTWEGPAADAAQGRVRDIGMAARRTVFAMRQLADHLDQLADEIEAWMRAEAQAEQDRLEAERRANEEPAPPAAPEAPPRRDRDICEVLPELEHC